MLRSVLVLATDPRLPEAFDGDVWRTPVVVLGEFVLPDWVVRPEKSEDDEGVLDVDATAGSTVPWADVVVRSEVIVEVLGPFVLGVVALLTGVILVRDVVGVIVKFDAVVTDVLLGSVDVVAVVKDVVKDGDEEVVEPVEIVAVEVVVIKLPVIGIDMLLVVVMGVTVLEDGAWHPETNIAASVSPVAG